MEKIHLEKMNTMIAEVKTVIPLNEEEKENLVLKLSEKYKKNIVLKEEIDETIIGGVFVKVGNDVIDGTIKSRLKDMKKLVQSRD